MQLLKTKSIESLKEKNTVENKENPNPYIRRFGSHIKSHFSHSRCEIFDSSEDEKGSLRNQVGTEMSSMNSLGSMQVEFNRPGFNNKSSLQNLDLLKRKNKVKKSNYRLGSISHIKNNPSIDRDKSNLHQTQKMFKEDIEEETEQAKTKFKLDIETSENNCGSLLIINKSDNSSNESIKSIGSDTDNLIEPGADFVLQLQNENKNKIQEENLDLKLDEQNSTANNSIFKSGGEKIEEEEPEKNETKNKLEIEN